MNWWAQNAWDFNPVFLVAWVFWVLFSIVLHELGHGVAAIRVGDDTPIYTGHMTWNPMVHLGPWSLIMFALFGFCWGAMPVNPSRFQGRFAETIVAAAGPAVNLGLFAIFVICAACWETFASGVADPFYTNMNLFWRAGAMINLMGVIFNLIPIPPLDGSRIVGDLYPPYNEFLRTEAGNVAAFIGFALLFFVFGGRVWGYATSYSMAAISWLSDLLGSLVGTPAVP